MIRYQFHTDLFHIKVTLQLKNILDYQRCETTGVP
jgi:hypothetical protein